MNGPYHGRFIADRRTVTLVELSATADEKVVRVTVAPGGTWEIALPAWYPPSVAVFADGAVGVWAVTRLFVLEEGSAPVRLDLVDEIRAVYAVGTSLCVVSELAVSLHERRTGAMIDSYEARDVLGGSWWQEDRLMVESGSGTPLMFRPAAQTVGYLGL